MKAKHMLNQVKNGIGRYAVILAFILLCLVLGLMSDKFFTYSNLMNTLRQISFNGIIAIGMTFVLITGGVDLSVGSVAALAALVAADLSVVTGTVEVPLLQGGAEAAQAVIRELPRAPLFVAILAGLGVALLCGLANGMLIARFRMSPFIATMGMMTIARGLAQIYCGGRPISNCTAEFFHLGTGNIVELSKTVTFPIPVGVLLLVMVLAYILLKKMRFGRHVLAVGGNETAATASGLNVSSIKIRVYMMSGVLAGISGILLSARINSASPLSCEGYELNAIAAAVIGGTSPMGGVGNVFFTIIGAMIIGTMSNGLDLLNVSSYYQQVIRGLIILIAVLLDYRSRNK